MQWIKKIFAVFLTSLLLSNISFAQDVDKKDPYEMMKQVSHNLFERLKAEKESIRQDPQLLKVVVEQELMPYIDHRYAALKVLGSHLKSEKNPDNVKAFVDAFHDYLITSYAQVLTLYSDQTVEFEPKKPLESGKRIISVKVEIIDAPRPNVKLEFKLREDKKSSDWYAFDMIAEGISLLSSKQSEWSTKIRTEGIPAVSAELTQLAAQPIRFEGTAQ